MITAAAADSQWSRQVTVRLRCVTIKRDVDHSAALLCTTLAPRVSQVSKRSLGVIFRIVVCISLSRTLLLFLNITHPPPTKKLRGFAFQLR